MVERDVESILREIRESVISQQHADRETAARSVLTETVRTGNGVAEGVSMERGPGHNESGTANNLSLINSYLTTTARAWDRLPPLMSNRSGLIARLELWLKRGLKRASHWFTWEQVNFNAAAHHAIRDLVPVVAAQEHNLSELRRLIEHSEARLKELEQHHTEMVTQLDALREALVNEIRIRDRAGEVRWKQTEVRIGEISNELRERDERLQGEQRVCFKQLALETSEAAVLEDRARRKTEALLEELQRRIAGIEGSKR